MIRRLFYSLFNSPWQKPDSSEVDEFLDALKKKFGFSKSNGSNGESQHSSSKFKWGWLLMGVLVLWGASGVFILEPQEQAVVLRFGKQHRIANPGPNYHFPFPIERILRERVTEVKRLEVGFRTISSGSPAKYRNIQQESLMLTGDESIVDVQFTVQYLIADLPQYLFGVKNVTQTIRIVSESAMRQVIGINTIDTVLTERKSQVEDHAKQLMSGTLKRYGAGIKVLKVKLQDVQPPERVSDSFKSVASAREAKERLINEAEGYANDLLPKAKGQAEQILNQARSYSVERTTTAVGETKRFLAILQEYSRAPDITRKRLLLETMEAVLPQMNKIIIKNDAQYNLMPFLPLNSNSGTLNSLKGQAPTK